MQILLGIVRRARLIQIVGALTPAASFEAGRLAAEQEWRQRELRDEWGRVRDKLDRKKLRAWLA